MQRLRIFGSFLTASAVVGVTTALAAIGDSTRAHALLAGNTFTVRGTIIFREADKTRLRVDVSGSITSTLPAGSYVYNVHESSVCEAPFTSAGGHFDASNAAPDTSEANHPFHTGDLGSLTIAADGRGTLTHVSSRISLNGGASVLNRSLVIADTNGNRVACGVIIDGLPPAPSPTPSQPT